MPFVSEAHCDAISIVGPKFLYQPVVELFRPLAFQKLNDLLPPIGKFAAISPARVDCISQGHLLWITRIPAIFCQANLLNGSLTSKWRQRRRRCCRVWRLPVHSSLLVSWSGLHWFVFLFH